MTGAPADATVAYTNAGPHTDVGTYTIGVKVSKTGYNDYTATATLTVKALNFTGITFEGKTVDYDGEAHTVTVTGAPADATVAYTNAGPHTDVGTYTIGVKVSKTGYNDYTATATVKINAVDFVGVSFVGESFEYDGLMHSIAVKGTLPSTASVVYSSNVQGITNSATEIGEYEITAVITDKNHKTLTLSATLKITASDEERFMLFAEGGHLYFQNAMDENELYLFDSETGEIVRVNADNAVDMIPYGDGMIYVNKTAFVSAIKTATISGTEPATENLLTAGGIRYVQVDGETLYYVKNSLTGSGIFKADLSGDEPVITCLSEGKAYFLKLVGSTLYFADGANGKKLSKINTTSQNQTRVLVVDEKINNLVYDDGVLYYTVNKLLGNYIEKYTISSETRRKLTIDAGESLTVIGGRLYYVNVDRFTTALIGSGIYSVDISPLVDSNLPGTLVIEGGEMGVCSLASDGDNLYYYDVEGYKLMQYNLDLEEAVNLLEGFVKPADPAPIATGSKLLTYGGNIYYQNLYDGKRLYCYNPVSGLNYAVTTDKVADFAIIGDVLYVNMVSFLVNNDTYAVNLKTGGEMVKINDVSAYEFVSDGTYLYYVLENEAGAMTAIHRCKMDGTEDEEVYDKGVTNLRLVGGKLYFVDGSNIHVLDPETDEDTTVKVDDREIHTTAFDTDGTYIYYRDMYGVGWFNKRLSRCKMDGTENVVLVADVDPVTITYKDGFVYYYVDTTATENNGLYKVEADLTESGEGAVILGESAGYYAKNYVIIGDKMYFVDYKLQLVGDCHLYVITLGEDEAELIA